MEGERKKRERKEEETDKKPAYKKVFLEKRKMWDQPSEKRKDMRKIKRDEEATGSA